MAKGTSPAASRGGSTHAVLYLVVGLLAVSTMVFALLWLLNPITAGQANEATRRRIEARAGSRSLRIVERAGRRPQGLEVHAQLVGDEFDALGKKLARLAQSRIGDPQANALAKRFFESPAGRAAEPAAVLTFPARGTLQSLEVYVLDAVRQLVYCRVGNAKEPRALQAEDYREVIVEVAEVAGGSAGTFSVPYYVPVGELTRIRDKLRELRGQLIVTTAAADPGRHLQSALSLRARLTSTGATVLIDQPDPLSITFTLRMPDDVAIARGLAEALAAASEKVTARHISALSDPRSFGELAHSVNRSPADLGDSLILQYGDRVKILPASDLVAKRSGDLASAARFRGEDVVLEALGGLLADRGVLYFADGHGERRTADAMTGGGLSRAAGRLKASGFDVLPVNLSEVTTLPANCKALVIAGPRKPYSPKIEDAIARHVERGGRLAVLLSPGDPMPVPGLLKRYGIVSDTSKTYRQVRVALNRKLDLVRGWRAEQIFFVAWSAVEILPPTQGARHETLRVAYPEMAGGPAQGPCVIAAARPVGKAAGPRVLVFGSIDSFSDQLIMQLEAQLPGVPSNLQLLVDAMRWLTQ